MTTAAPTPINPQQYGLAILDNSDYDTEFDKYVISDGEARYINHSAEPCHDVLKKGLECDDVHAYKGNTWWINGPEAREYTAAHMIPIEPMDVFATYTQERKAGFGSKEALRRARTIAAWEVLGGYFEFSAANADSPRTQTPTVRLVIDDDPEGYDDSYLDEWDDVPDAVRAEIRAGIIHCSKWYGVVMVCAEWWNGEEWEHADSARGFIGNEWQGSGLDVDLMQAAMDAYAKPLHILELMPGVWEISEDREELLATCGLFDQNPDDVVSTIARAKLRDYTRVNANLYRRED